MCEYYSQGLIKFEQPKSNRLSVTRKTVNITIVKSTTDLTTINKNLHILSPLLIVILYL